MWHMPSHANSHSAMMPLTMLYAYDVTHCDTLATRGQSVTPG
ncbi:hypothetical protein BIFGAL_03250 [Bifidobacterium gallicum DSM 20093 = LMG 11596]|uniref:Uncharacterized protein n=1 Tax=Bifidobacterium gallicum DSM 20093 = LMG 11596 TaxID=561180 RepID=D1NTT3_9BIFI|nr:hypothetical protein BIFGAL_03250 [Bifidobacterium gallicum DSM 20093 = LMG 11596]